MLKLDQPYTLEFSYYSCAVTLPLGDIIITGGGISNQTFLLRNPMQEHRKEHGMVYINNQIYVIGGYNPPQNIFLKSCEKYNIEQDKWTSIANMNFQNCAFGCTTFNNQYILTFGGYDGTNRLNIIEQYSVQNDVWTLLNLKLLQPLSNSTCFQSNENQVLIMGGGYDLDFCYDIIIVDFLNNTVQLIQKKIEIDKTQTIKYGNDIRNKGIKFQDHYYILGGRQFKGEKYNIITEQWVNSILKKQTLKSYCNLKNDNLDSWCCALTFQSKDEIQNNLQYLEIVYNWDNNQLISNNSSYSNLNLQMSSSNRTENEQLDAQEDEEQDEDEEGEDDGYSNLFDDDYYNNHEEYIYDYDQ